MTVRLQVSASTGDSTDDTTGRTLGLGEEFTQGSRIRGGRIADKLGSRLGFTIIAQSIPRQRQAGQMIEDSLQPRPVFGS